MAACKGLSSCFNGTDQRYNSAMQRICLAVFCCLLVTCGRKDVHRDGSIRLRGEKPISLRGAEAGELLQEGTASWYGPDFHGRQTANGERYDMDGMTAAHKTLPFGTVIKVVNRDNGKTAVLRVNDRGPFVAGRILDVSRGGARALGMIGPGTARVSIYLHNAATMERKPTKGYWTLQVGSFGTFEAARNVYLRLEHYGVPVELQRYDNLYRVRLGQFKSEQEADRLCELLKDEHLGCWILHVD
ncbi:MAG: septal ring lytic transglycosylase RlpA family protein [Acidobacteria bacterium]|nr:septal ring lytic transglycosylase RlpA family protein [Acidobacteriota bacterium]